MMHFPKPAHRIHPGLVICAWLSVLGAAHGADYNIVLVDGAHLSVTDSVGNSDVLTIAEAGPGFISFAVPGRTFSLNGAAPLTGSSGGIALAGILDITVDAAGGADTLNIGAFATLLPNLTLNGGSGNDRVNFTGDLNLSADSTLEVDLLNDDANPGSDSIALAANAHVRAAGVGNIVMKCSRDLFLDTGASVEVIHGQLQIRANTQIPHTSGNFQGLSLAGASIVCSGTGTVDLQAFGGDTGDFNAGIYLTAGAMINGGLSGLLRATGNGGASPGQTGYGIFMDGAGTRIGSLGGAIQLGGVGGGGGTGGFNSGIVVQNGAQISAAGSGSLEITGNGGGGNGLNNVGVSLVGTNTAVLTAGGNLSITARGGGNTGNSNYGMNMQNGPMVRAGGSGAVDITATGGPGIGRTNLGLNLTGANTQITSQGGNVTVSGTGGGSGVADSAHGVLIQNAGAIRAGGLGSVTVSGTGGPGTGSTNIGVFLSGAGSQINSGGGNVFVTGQGGGAGVGSNNYGLNPQNGAVISAGGMGTVTVSGTGGRSSGAGNYGIFMVTGSNTLITSSGGNIAVTGTAGSGTSGDCRGMQLQTGPGIAGVGPASVSLNCTGGLGAGSGNHGLRLVAGVSVTSVDGDISITTRAGNAEAVAFSLSNVSVSGAKVQTTGLGGINIAADSMDISTTGVSIDASTHLVTLRPLTPGTALDLGSANFTAPGVLELSDSELDRVIAGSLIVGDPGAGQLRISAPITCPSPLTLRSALAYVPSLSGVEITTSRLTLPPGQEFAPAINGLVPDTQFTQLNIAGGIQIGGSKLKLTGTYFPVVGQSFLIVKNDGTDPVEGTFDSLPENAPLGFNGALLRISYHAGDGNDVVLNTVEIPPPIITHSLVTPSPGATMGAQVQLTVDASPALTGAAFELQFSDNLLDWFPLAQRTVDTSGIVAFNLFDPNAGNRRFYRYVKK